jgi:hypothetical protein
MSFALLFLVVRRVRADIVNWVVALVGLVLMALVLVYWSAIVQVSHRWLGSAPGFSVQAFSFSAAPVASSSSIQGHPTLSASFVDRVLTVAHSPAVGLGNALYQDSVTYGIDDAYALAFFQHESTFGTAGVARVTHSLGNIRCTAGWSWCISGYRAYASFQAGALDWFRVLSREYVAHGLVTLEQIIPVYAPGSDGNDVHGYIVAVRSAVASWRAGYAVVVGGPAYAN